MSKRDLSPDSLEAQADALLAAADSMDIPDEIPMPGKSSRSGKAAKAARPEADHIMTDEEAKKASIVRLDDKQVAALPAASWLMGQEKLRELLARGKKKGKLDSGELMETVDDLNLESDQMDQLYDSLEALNIDIGTEEDLLPELPDDEPAAEEIADVEEEELVDPNSLVSNFSIDDPVRMYLKEIGKVPLLNPDEEIVLAQAMAAGAEAKARLDELQEQREAGETPAVTPEEEAELRKAFKKGESAKQKLAEANLRLVVSIAKRYVGRGMLFLDLIQEGNLGLIKAVEGLQVLHLRNLVDPAGHHPRHRGSGPYHPDPRSHGGDYQQGHPCLPSALAGAWPRSQPQRDRQGDEHARGQGPGDPEDRSGACVSGNPHR